MNLGRDPEGTKLFSGKIDEVRIWNTSRTRDEILSNMYTILNGNESGLVAYYRFDQGNAKYNSLYHIMRETLLYNNSCCIMVKTQGSGS